MTEQQADQRAADASSLAWLQATAALSSGITSSVQLRPCTHSWKAQTWGCNRHREAETAHQMRFPALCLYKRKHYVSAGFSFASLVGGKEERERGKKKSAHADAEPQMERGREGHQFPSSNLRKSGLTSSRYFGGVHPSEFFYSLGWYCYQATAPAV